MPRARLMRSPSATRTRQSGEGFPTTSTPLPPSDLVEVSVAFSPSEIVLLRAHDLVVSESTDLLHGLTTRFVGQDGLSSVPRGVVTHLFEGQRDLASDAWAMAMLTTAFLAMERDGRCRFEMREKPRWAGLSKRDALFAVPIDDGQAAFPWPVPSLERQLYPKAEARAIGDIVVDWFGAPSESPGRSALQKARDNLVSRGLVDEERRTRWLIAVDHRYTVPAEIREHIPEASETVSLIVDRCRQRPGMWSALNLEVRRALEDRTDHSDDFDWSD